ncbi:RelA/SpoT domain-containing protein [uncultured Microscilla sp.]|uniref:RelA/SpoT domain-containing protein n=1 Tax=uncultured Microscilla sp. TaxID=432653 RepID=UPI002624F2A0|nr:RelA/SpoT domain-containing protein [uncultured Microscilla sp.]
MPLFGPSKSKSKKDKDSQNAQNNQSNNQQSRSKKKKKKSTPKSGDQSSQPLHNSKQATHSAKHKPHKSKHTPHSSKHAPHTSFRSLNDSGSQSSIKFSMESKHIDAKVTHTLDLLKQEFKGLEMGKHELHAQIIKYLVNRENIDPNKLDEPGLAMAMHKYMAPSFVKDPRSRKMTAGTMNDRLEQQMYADKVDKLHPKPQEKAQYIDRMNSGGITPQKDDKGRLHQGIDLQNPVDSEAALLELLIQANLSQKEFDAQLAKVQGMLDKGKRQVTAHKSDIKGWDRAYDKQQNKYHDATLIKDLVRGTLIFNSVTDLVQGRNYIYDCFTIYGTKNSIGHPTATGYQDMKINVRLTTGHIGELQLHLQSMVSKKDQGGHGLYRFIRDFDEGKTSDFSDDPKKAVKRLKPVLRTLKANKQKAITNHQNKTGLSTKRGPLNTRKHDRKIAFVKWLIASIEHGQTFNLNQDEGTLLKEISRDIYASAEQDIAKEISYSSDLKRVLKVD